MPPPVPSGLLLGHVLDLQAELGPVAELGLEYRGLIRRAQDHVLDARRGDPRQQMGEERQPGGRQHRLGRRQRQRPQPGALTADQDHRIDSDGLPPQRRPSASLPSTGLRNELRTIRRERTANDPRNVQRSGARHQPECRSARKI